MLSVALLGWVLIILLGLQFTTAQQRKIYSQAPQKDNSLSCIGPEWDQICCRNCTSCCKEHGQCNFGEGNSGWGNIGDDNFGDFNIANNTFGDCNVEDESYGIGGPEYNGCSKDVQDHIVRFCAINPYFIKCHTPPIYYGDELYDRLKEVVLGCDSKIQFRAKETVSNKRRKRKVSKSKMPRTKVMRKIGQAGRPEATMRGV